MHRELEKCERALNEYLDMKKNVFPRYPIRPPKACLLLHVELKTQRYLGGIPQDVQLLMCSFARLATAFLEVQQYLPGTK